MGKTIGLMVQSFSDPVVWRYNGIPTCFERGFVVWNTRSRLLSQVDIS